MQVVRVLEKFLVWRQQAGLSADPEEWIGECIGGTTATLVRHAKLIRDWAESSPQFEEATMESRGKYMQDVRSFYAHNMVQLPPTKLSRRDDASVQTQVTATEYIAMLQKVFESGAIGARDRAVMMTMFQSGMDESTLARVFNFAGYGQLVEALGPDPTIWDPRKAPVKVDLTRPKTDYRYYSFLGHDSILLLKEWLILRARAHGPLQVHPRKQPKALPLSDPIFVTKYGTPITAHYVSGIFRGAGKLIGVNVPPTQKAKRHKGASIRYPLQAHQLRDSFITLRQRAHVDRVVVDFFAGHKFDADSYDNPWDNPELFRTEYLKLMPHLDLITGKDRALEERYEERLQKELTERNSQLTAQVAKLQADVAHILAVDRAKYDPSLTDLKRPA